VLKIGGKMKSINDNISDYIQKSNVFFIISCLLTIIIFLIGKENLTLGIFIKSLSFAIILFIAFLVNFISFSKQPIVFGMFQAIFIFFCVVGIIKIGALTILISLNIYLLFIVFSKEKLLTIYG